MQLINLKSMLLQKTPNILETIHSLRTAFAHTEFHLGDLPDGYGCCKEPLPNKNRRFLSISETFCVGDIKKSSTVYIICYLYIHS